MAEKSWAENEVEIVLNNLKKKQTEDYKYTEAVLNAALEVYSVLAEQGHSGLSYNYTCQVLKDLLDRKPLTPITGEDDEWGDKETIQDGKACQQNKRRTSLFKYTFPDGTIKYSDVDRVRSAEVGTHDYCWCSGISTRVVDELFPITLPYYPEGTFLVDFVTINSLCENILFNCGDYNGVFVYSFRTPDGKRYDVNRLFLEDEDGRMNEVKLEDADKELVDELMAYVKECESNNG